MATPAGRGRPLPWRSRRRRWHARRAAACLTACWLALGGRPCALGRCGVLGAAPQAAQRAFGADRVATSRASAAEGAAARQAATSSDLAVDVVYSQTTSRAPLPGDDELVERYMAERSSSELLCDIANGYNLRLPEGRPKMLVGVVDLEAGAHTISYPAGEWHAPAGLGNVVVAGPELSVLLLDAALCGEPLPRHRPRARAESRLTNGDDLLRVSLTLPLVPPLRFNVSVSCEFTMELGYGGGGASEDAEVTVGLEGQFGLSVPRFPGAQRLLSAFLPGYCQASMQQAATGLSESFKASTASPPAG